MSRLRRFFVEKNGSPGFGLLMLMAVLAGASIGLYWSVLP